MARFWVSLRGFRLVRSMSLAALLILMLPAHWSARPDADNDPALSMAMLVGPALSAQRLSEGNPICPASAGLAPSADCTDAQMIEARFRQFALNALLYPQIDHETDPPTSQAPHESLQCGLRTVFALMVAP